MFLWIRLDPIDYLKAKDIKCINENKMACLIGLEHRIYTRAREYGVLVSKGSWFLTKLSQTGDIHFRLTFAAAAHKDLETAVARFSNGVECEVMIDSLAEDRGASR